jgi:hypothetical protein
MIAVFCSRFRSGGVAVVLLAAALLTAHPAESAPITTFHTTLFDSSGDPVSGTITASLDFYIRPYGGIGGACCAPLGPAVLVDQFSLGAGSDFLVFIPQSILDARTSWEVPIPPGAGIDGGFPLPGLNIISAGFPLPTSVAELRNWCSPGGTFVNTVFPLARRGDCAFVDKVVNIQAANGVGAVIINNIVGGGAVNMALPLFTPAVPVISLSYERGLQILQALNATGTDTTPDLGYFDFSARWDPDPVVAPEPASLFLFTAGLAGFGAVQRARRGSSSAGARRLP